MLMIIIIATVAYNETKFLYSYLNIIKKLHIKEEVVKMLLYKWMRL